MRSWPYMLGALLGLMNQSCNAMENHVRFYVLAPESRAGQVTEDIASIIEQIGFEAESGGHSDDHGNKFSGVVAEKKGVMIWVQNVYVRTDADPSECGHVEESFPDPGQFVVDIESNLSEDIADIAEDTKDGFVSLGYDVSDKPVDCSPIARKRRD